MEKKNKIRVEEGSGNIFADLGFANPKQEELKARRTLQKYRANKERMLTQKETEDNGTHTDTSQFDSQ